MPNLAEGLTYYIVFLFSTTLHEAAHAWAAKRGGDLTAYQGGQVTLDPLPHIRREPFGMVILPIISVLISGWPFGFASAPYDPAWARRHPKRAARMALAGPAANLLLVVLSGLLIRLGTFVAAFYPPESIHFGYLAGAEPGLPKAIAILLSIFFSLNLLLFAFNLLPLPPLDGSGAIPLFLSPRASETYQDFLIATPGVAWIGMLIAWQIFDVVFDPIFLGAANLLYPGVGYH
ncbi:MAG TPA: site-2 protease family protein [Longimicrobium sp.]|nr:site-2 protease family protein [Longimicrobium sp.]